jgi:alanine racemase
MTNNLHVPEQRTWIEIDAQAFSRNISNISSLLGDHAELGIVIKANAYGHGLEIMGRLCQENEAISWIFTAGLKEAVHLRMSGITKPILVLAYLDDQLSLLGDYQIACAIHDYSSAHRISAQAQLLKKQISVHIKVDTGMSRFGFKPEELEDFLPELMSLPGLNIAGLFTHLSDTNNSDYSFIDQQLAGFDKIADEVEKQSGTLYKHVIASGALHLPRRFNGVRVGTNAYGYWKSPLQQQRLLRLKPDMVLQPILTWKTRIISLKTLSTGDAVGYHRAFIATAPLKIAILPVGYYDGYPRALSHKARVIIRQTSVPILGIISMNSMVVDVTHISEVCINDEVVLCGDFPGLRPLDLATMSDSIPNEFLARLSTLIPRVVI